MEAIIMTERTNQGARLWTLASVLQGAHLTTGEIAARYGVSRWTVWRDLLLLRTEPYNQNVQRDDLNRWHIYPMGR